MCIIAACFTGLIAFNAASVEQMAIIKCSRSFTVMHTIAVCQNSKVQHMGSDNITFTPV